MFRSGEFIASQFDGLRDDTEHEQPNGVDLTVESVYRQVGSGKVTKDGKEIGDREEIAPTTDGFYNLSEGGYIVQYGETITVPEGHLGLVLPRSSLMRNGAMLHTAVWDSGYTGKGEGLLVVHEHISIEHAARIGQFILSDCDTDEAYDGTYQNENVD